jgi:hypothetical protein
MSTPTAPSFFEDVYNVVYTPGGSGSSTPISIYGVKSISYDRSATVLKGMDNLKLRPVAAHETNIVDTVTIDSEDLYGLQQLMTSVGPGQLLFNQRAAAHNSVSGNQLPDQTVQITGLFWEKKNLGMPSKNWHSYKLSGFCMEASGGDATDVISFANTSSPPNDNEN